MIDKVVDILEEAGFDEIDIVRFINYMYSTYGREWGEQTKKLSTYLRLSTEDYVLSTCVDIAGNEFIDMYTYLVYHI